MVGKNINRATTGNCQLRLIKKIYKKEGTMGKSRAGFQPNEERVLTR